MQRARTQVSDLMAKAHIVRRLEGRALAWCHTCVETAAPLRKGELSITDARPAYSAFVRVITEVITVGDNLEIVAGRRGAMAMF